MRHEISCQEISCPVDGGPCEGQGTEDLCAFCRYTTLSRLLALDIPPSGDPPQYIVDHRYANSQVRFRLLQMITTGTKTLDEVATKSRLSKEHLISICLGKSGVSYLQMADLAKALFGERTELRVIMPWVECGFSYSEENACTEDEECQRLLERGHKNGTIPEKVWINE